VQPLDYEPRKRFGKNLATVRRSLGWSQESLAQESGLARSYLSGVERGIRNIALVNICKLAHTLSISPSQLMNFDTTPEPHD
jgi:transcriptional regulator with XRE-family HTH domain